MKFEVGDYVTSIGEDYPVEDEYKHVIVAIEPDGFAVEITRMHRNRSALMWTRRVHIRTLRKLQPEEIL